MVCVWGARWASLLLFHYSVVSDSLWPHGLQHARLPRPSPSPRACSNSCPLSRWCHPTFSSSVAPFSSCPQSFPASGSFLMNGLPWWLRGEDPMDKGIETHSSVLSWSIPWTEEPCGLQSMGSQRVRRDWETNFPSTEPTYMWTATSRLQGYLIHLGINKIKIISKHI